MSKLHGAILKTQRAGKHIEDLDLVVRLFCDTNPCRIFVDKNNPKTGYQSVIVADVVKVPDIIGVLAGEAVNNLRSALDYVAWELVNATTGAVSLKAKDLRRIQFPLLPTSNDATSEAILGYVPCVSAEIVELIRGVQPYQAGYRPLAEMVALNRIDKHRTIVTAVAACMIAEHGIRFEGQFIDTNRFDPEFVAKQKWSIAEKGKELAVFEPLNSADAEVHPELHFVLDVAFGEVNPPTGIVPLCTQVKTFHEIVTRILTLFEPHLSSP